MPYDTMIIIERWVILHINGKWPKNYIQNNSCQGDNWAPNSNNGEYEIL